MKKDLLMKNEGCFICCQNFWVDHHAANCSYSHPLPVNYQAHTQAMADEALRLKNVTASVSVNTGSLLGIIEVDNNKLGSAAVLGHGLDSEEDMSALPYYLPHLYWTCHLTGPKTEFPICV